MRIINYIRGDRKGKVAHSIEREMLSKPFLYEAIEGYEKYSDDGELSKDISELHREIASRSSVKKNGWVIWAAVVIGVIVVLTLLYLFVFKETFSRSRWATNANGKPLTTQVEQKSNLVASEIENGKPDNISLSDSLDLDVERDIELEGDVAEQESEESQESGDSGVVESQPTLHVESTEPPVTDKAIEATPIRDEPTETTKIKDEPVAEVEVKDYSTKGNETGEGIRLRPTLDVSSESNIAKEGDEGHITAPRTGIRRYNEYLREACTLSSTAELGDVVISFWVNGYGRPSTIRIVSSPSTEANREVIRLLDSGPEWYPTKDTVTVTVRLRK